MFLADDEKRMLDGDYGPGVQKAMELLVALGKAFDAERLIPVSRTHVALSGQEGDTYWCTMLADGGAKCKIAPTTNPAWDVNTLSKRFEVTEAELELAVRTIDSYRRIGAVLSFCCTPELESNVPVFGEHVAFSESSATPYVNSVLGARSNRESSVSALASAVTGKTPLYGLHLSENRVGQFMVLVEAEMRDPYDWGILGWYIGKFAGNRIPVIRVVNMKQRPAPEDLLYMGAEMNTSGAVPMYHIEDVTPEALMQKHLPAGKAFDVELVVGDRELKDQQEELFEKIGPINLVMLGCPHYTYAQIREVEHLLNGRHVKKGVDFWILTSFYTLELAARSGERSRLKDLGVELVADTCIDEPCWKSFEGGLGMTDSPKCAYYRKRRGQPFVVRRLHDCIEAAVEQGGR